MRLVAFVAEVEEYENCLRKHTFRGSAASHSLPDILPGHVLPHEYFSQWDASCNKDSISPPNMNSDIKTRSEFVQTFYKNVSRFLGFRALCPTCCSSFLSHRISVFLASSFVTRERSECRFPAIGISTYLHSCDPSMGVVE